MTKKNITFILHKPQLSENIGACARGIKNFGFNKLSLIDPKPLFPNDKILATSVGAKDIIKNSKIYKSLEEAIENEDIHIDSWADEDEPHQLTKIKLVMTPEEEDKNAGVVRDSNGNVMSEVTNG